MANKTASLLPPTEGLLIQFSDRLRMARLRRRLTARQVAERAGMSPMTLRSLERGGSGVTMGAYLAVMQVLGIETDIDLLAKADSAGRELQDARLPARKTAVGSNAVQIAQSPFGLSLSKPRYTRRPVDPSAGSGQAKLRAGQGTQARDWIERSGFTSSAALMDLIDSPAAHSRKRR